MSKGQRSFTQDFKLAALKRMAETDNIRQLALDLGVERRLLYCWRDAYALKGASGLRRAGRPSAVEQLEAAMLVAEVYQAPARLPASIDEPMVEDAALPRSDPAERLRVERLERKIGEQQVALDFFRSALLHVKERRRRNGAPGGTVSTP